MKSNNDPFSGLGLALLVYFVVAFSLCFAKPSHHQFGCVLTGIFLYPLVLVFPVAIIVVVNSILVWRKKRIPPGFIAASIMVYGPLLVLGMKLFRHFADGLWGVSAVAAISCAIGWAFAVLRPSYRNRNSSMIA
jgi:hypothetical protein